MIEHLSPKQAWQFMQTHSDAVLVDVRTKIEYNFVGHPVGAVHIAWKEFPDWQTNPEFIAHVKKQIPSMETPVLLLCRSGQRSLEAATLLASVGFNHLINIDEGFEGPLDADKHRGLIGGWRCYGLPWEQT